MTLGAFTQAAGCIQMDLIYLYAEGLHWRRRLVGSGGSKPFIGGKIHRGALFAHLSFFVVGASAAAWASMRARAYRAHVTTPASCRWLNHGEIREYRHLDIISRSSLSRHEELVGTSLGTATYHLDISRACAGVSPVGLGRSTPDAVGAAVLSAAAATLLTALDAS